MLKSSGKITQLRGQTKHSVCIHSASTYY